MFVIEQTIIHGALVDAIACVSLLHCCRIRFVVLIPGDCSQRDAWKPYSSHLIIR
jgi:hypothetical protein